ncbi:hypothetical protein BH23ACT3_BH23ACT3_14130 [soil metagenome]
MLGTLLSAGEPVSIGGLVERLSGEPRLGPVTPKRIADVLAQQVRMGRVRRVRRGVYEMVPGGVSRSTEWRCRNWHRSVPNT